MCFFYSKLWTFRKKKTHKKSQPKKKGTSFFHEPCVLPASPSSPSPHFSTDRNLTVANLHVLASPNSHCCSDLIDGIGKNPAPYFSSTLEMLQYCPVPLEQGLPLPGMHEPAHLLCAQPDSKCRAPPGPPFSRWNPPPPSLWVSWRLSWAGQWLCSPATAKGLSHQLPDGIPFPCPNTHMQAGHCCLVTLPCLAGAGVGVCKLLCITCTVSFWLQHRLFFLD